MRAVICHAFGPPASLTVADVDRLTPGPGEAVVRVHAAGVNFPDVLIIENKYQVKPPLPFSPGGEVAGVVTAVGDGVGQVGVGARVIAIMSHGGFAEEVRVPASRLLPMPPGMDFTTAAGFVFTYATADHALRDRAALAAGETLLVLGAAGGVGLAAVEIGKALGARVVAGASSGDKLALCRAHGADATIDYVTEDLRERVRALTAGAGVDVVFDPVGGSYTEPALRSCAWRGRLLVVGFAAGEIPRIPLNLPLLKGCAIVGVFWGDFTRREPQRFRESVEQLGRWYAEGRLRPHVSATFPLERAADALDMIKRRQATGKIVLEVV